MSDGQRNVGRAFRICAGDAVIAAVGRKLRGSTCCTTGPDRSVPESLPTTPSGHRCRAPLPLPQIDITRRKLVVQVVIVVERQPDLLHVVPTLRPTSGLPRLLNRGEQQGDQDRDNRDHNEQFDEGEPSSMASDHTAPWRTAERDRKMQNVGIDGERLSGRPLPVNQASLLSRSGCIDRI